jgi:hypothetical protein
MGCNWAGDDKNIQASKVWQTTLYWFLFIEMIMVFQNDQIIYTNPPPDCWVLRLGIQLRM